MTAALDGRDPDQDFATALTFSQVATAPDAVKTQFDPAEDQKQVVGLLRAGCAQMRKAFDIEDLNVDDLIATAMDDADAIASGHAAFRGINIKDLHTAYRNLQERDGRQLAGRYRRGDRFYNRTLADLPDHTGLKGMRLPGASVVLDRKGERIAEVFEQDHRRVWVPLAEIPAHVQQAFVAAEDKRFYQHRGVDERALIRAFIGNLASPAVRRAARPSPAGGEEPAGRRGRDLRAQDAGDDPGVAHRAYAHETRDPRALSQLDLLGPRLLGRRDGGPQLFWDAGVGAEHWRGRAHGRPHQGPNYFNPERNPGRAKERYTYVLGRMQEDGAISAEEAKYSASAFPALAPYDGHRNLAGSYFADQVAREIRTTGDRAFRLESYTIHSTLHPDLQRATEMALQDGLARYEADSGRAEFHGPETNLTDAIGRIEAAQAAPLPVTLASESLEKLRRLAACHERAWHAAVVTKSHPQRRGRRCGCGLDHMRPPAVHAAAAAPLHAPAGRVTEQWSGLRGFDPADASVRLVSGRGIRHGRNPPHSAPSHPAAPSRSRAANRDGAWNGSYRTRVETPDRRWS